MMNSVNLIPETKQNKKQNILIKLANLTAKITLKFNIPMLEFVEAFKSALVKRAQYDNPKNSIVELSCRTGIDRRYIKQYLSVENKKIKPSKLKLILEQIRQITKRNDTKFINKIGPFQSFESVCLDIASGSLTHNAIAKELIRLGNIVDYKNRYEIVELSYTPVMKNQDEHLRLLSIEMERLTDTIIHNSNTVNTKHKQFQRNIFSTQIPPEYFQLAKVRFSRILKRTLKSIDKVIGEYEEDTPIGTYPSFGASMFVFGYETEDSSN